MGHGVLSDTPPRTSATPTPVVTRPHHARKHRAVTAKSRGIRSSNQAARCSDLLTRRYSNLCWSLRNNGKTTTTSMLTHLLIAAGSILGRHRREARRHRRLAARGDVDTLVVESLRVCRTSDLSPICGVLNIDADHIDYFKNSRQIIRFSRFANHLPHVIYNGDDLNAREAVRGSSKAPLLRGERCVRLLPQHISGRTGLTAFDLFSSGRFEHLTHAGAGNHNVLNAVRCARHRAGASAN